MATPDSTKPDLSKIDLVQEHAAKAAHSAAEEFECQLSERLLDTTGGVLSRLLDSPAEAVFWMWWTAYQAGMGDHLFRLRPQVHAKANGKNYRLDFAIELEREEDRQLLVNTGMAWPLLGVEIDGHTFHEKTLAQVTKRNQRDRDLQSKGWRVFHVSFSELTTNSHDCIHELYSVCHDVFCDVLLRAHRMKEEAQGVNG